MISNRQFNQCSLRAGQNELGLRHLFAICHFHVSIGLTETTRLLNPTSLITRQPRSVRRPRQKIRQRFSHRNVARFSHPCNCNQTHRSLKRQRGAVHTEVTTRSQASPRDNTKSCTSSSLLHPSGSRKSPEKIPANAGHHPFPFTNTALYGCAKRSVIGAPLHLILRMGYNEACLPDVGGQSANSLRCRLCMAVTPFMFAEDFSFAHPCRSLVFLCGAGNVQPPSSTVSRL